MATVAVLAVNACEAADESDATATPSSGTDAPSLWSSATADLTDRAFNDNKRNRGANGAGGEKGTKGEETSTTLATATTVAPITTPPTETATTVAPTTTTTTTPPTTTTTTTTTTPPTTTTTTTTTTPPTTTTTTTPPTTVPSEPGGLPAGVTLVEPDGGPDYFGQWANSFPTDPTFFPIGVWAEGFQDDQATRDRMDAYAGMGINTFVEPYGWPASADAHAAANGQWAVGSPVRSRTAASKTTDEPDWRGCWGTNGVHGEMSADHRARVAAKDPTGRGRECWNLAESWSPPRTDGPTAPSFMQAWSDVVREDDPTRPVFNQHTKLGRAGHPTPGVEDWWVGVEAARGFAAAADIVSNDWYIVPDPWTTNAIKTFVTDDPRYPKGVWVGNVWEEHDAAKRLRSHAKHDKPVWMFVSTSNGGGCNYYPTPQDVNAVVWNQLIGGARGIEYFNHDFCDQYGTTARALLTDHPYYRSIRAQVTETNHRIGILAPVLNADFAEGYASVADGKANVMVKYHGGNWYVFVTPRSRDTQQIAIDLADIGSGTAEVLFEERQIDVSDGRLVDTFEDQNTVHIYRIPG